MTPEPASRSGRRTARSVAIGAAALGVAVALPAFAIDRGGDGGTDADTAAGAVAPTSTTSTTIDPALLAAQAQAQADAFLAWHASLTPEEQFAFQWSIWTEQERAAFTDFAAGQQAAVEAYLETTYQAQVAAERARAAKAAQARVSSSGASSGGSGVWDRLAQCEAGGNWSYPTISGGYSGGLMFHYATWNANGGQAYAPTAGQATREQQIEIAEKVLANSGWGAWPGCSRKLGLR
jgi:hypothetical protein